jgi:2-polyprenyl-3-methyl-5-hydroxy-6-metoxy-1,4-benzoquinol methylase
VIFGDAIVERGRNDARPSPLYDAITCTATVAEIVSRAQADPHLRRTYARREDVVLELLALDALGSVRVSPPALGDALRSYYETRVANGDRSLAYVATYERNWREHRDLYDFAEARDANARRKAFQRDLYLGHLAPLLDRLPPGTTVLDAGCGVGRLTPALVTRGFRVTCVDASAEALKCAARVALRSGAGLDAFDARLCDVRDLSCFADGEFGATIALELICYQEDPETSLRELMRVTAPGGLLAVSVEGLHGSAIADPKLGLDVQTKVLDTAGIDMDDHISIRYFTKGGLRALLESAGLEAIAIVGTQYTADGVLDRLVTDEALADPTELARLAALERKAAADPVLAPLARAWLATARMPDRRR